MSYGILLLRVVVGLTMAAHGAQKMFGWFGGPGLRGAGGFFGHLRFRGAGVMAAVASFAEVGGGVLLALGLVTPFAALAIVTVMMVAIATVHWPKGFFNSEGGFEFNLLILAAATALAATGGARFSLDNALGVADNLGGLWWGLGVLGAGALIAVAILTVMRAPAPAAVPEARLAQNGASQRRAA